VLRGRRRAKRGRGDGRGGWSDWRRDGGGLVQPHGVEVERLGADRRVGANDRTGVGTIGEASSGFFAALDGGGGGGGLFEGDAGRSEARGVAAGWPSDVSAASSGARFTSKRRRAIGSTAR
jgi:hypothetical protein